MAQQTTKPKQTIIRDKSAKKYFSQIPHLVRLLPMSPYAKLVYWDLKAVADQFAHEPEAASDMLTGRATALRLGIGEASVSRSKQELVAFGLICILTQGTRDLIEIEDIWPRNIAHFAGTPDPMMGTPPTPAAIKTGRKHVRKSPKNQGAKSGVAPTAKTGAETRNQAGQDSNRESSDALKIPIGNLEDSLLESSTTTSTGSNINKEVRTTLIEEVGASSPESASPQLPLTPMPGNPVAAPNAPNPPRRQPRKPNLHSAKPTTVEQEPRLADPRIVSFNEIFGREKVLWLAEIDDICDRVKPDEQTQWAEACRKWSQGTTADGRPYRIDLDDSIEKLISFHLRNLRARPQTTAGNPAGTPTSGPAASTRPSYLTEPKGFAGIREWIAKEGLDEWMNSTK